LSGKGDPIQDVAEILQEVGQIRISGSTVWRITQEWGQKIKKKKIKPKAVANATPERDELISGEAVRSRADGGLNGRGDGVCSGRGMERASKPEPSSGRRGENAG